MGGIFSLLLLWKEYIRPVEIGGAQRGTGSSRAIMRVDFASLFQALADCLGQSGMTDSDAGMLFMKTMRALVRFDDVVIFAYRGKERPIDLFSTFGPQDHEVFVSLYQAGPFLLDPFYHAARSGKTGVFRMRELAPDRFFSSEYYRTYYSQTKLAEETGFFVARPDGVTVVLSLMRRERSGTFPAGEFSLLADAAPFVEAFVGMAWPQLSRRFDTLAKGSSRRRREPANAADRIWRKLNLTDREAAIVELVLQGFSSESIGLTLAISTGTVKVHSRNVYRKLGISSQMQLLSVYLKSLEA